MKKSTSIILIVSFSLVLSGCPGTFKQANIFSGTPYRFNGFQTKGIRLGFVTPSSARGLEQDKWYLLTILAENLNKMRPSIKVILPNKCLSLVNQAGINKEYTRMIQDYKISGILEKKVLSKLGEIIGVDYLLHLSLTGFDQSEKTRFSLFSLRLISSQQAKMRASIKIWTKDGAIVWENQAENIISTEALRARPITFGKIAQLISGKLVTRLP